MNRVHVFDLRQRSGSKNPWYVRWRVDGRDASRQFRTKAAARDFHARLLVAADRDEPFDATTKLPASMTPPVTATPPPITCYQAAVRFMAHKWTRWAATSRRSAVETLVTAVPTLLRPGTPATRPQQPVHRWLRDIALVPPFDDFTSLAEQCRDDADRQAHAWLQAHSLPVTDLDVRHAEAALDAFTRRRDGAGLTAPTVISRKRTQFGGFLRYCIREQWLPVNPLSQTDWKTPLVDKEINPELLMAPVDAHRLLDVLPTLSPIGERLTAFFATLFYAGLRPSEALALTPSDLALPGSGWGQITVRRARTKTSSRYTDDGSPHQERPLKWRSQTAIRQVPIPPQLVEHLRRHLQAFHPTSDGAAFTNLAGHPLDHAQYQRVFHQAKERAFEPGDPLHRVTPYGLRHANATMLLNAGIAVADAARRLGHSPEVLLAIYAGVMTNDEALSNTRIDALLQATQGGTD